MLTFLSPSTSAASFASPGISVLIARMRCSSAWRSGMETLALQEQSSVSRRHGGRGAKEWLTCISVPQQKHLVEIPRGSTAGYSALPRYTSYVTVAGRVGHTKLPRSRSQEGARNSAAAAKPFSPVNTHVASSSTTRLHGDTTAWLLTAHEMLCSDTRSTSRQVYVRTYCRTSWSIYITVDAKYVLRSSRSSWASEAT